jgi:chorismate mutase
MRAAGLPPSLRLARGLIDAVDGAVLALLAGRQGLAAQAARSKRRAGLGNSDPAREARVHAHAQRVAASACGRPTRTP